MIEYNVEISNKFYDDMDKIIEWKEEYVTYQSNIDEFKNEVNARLLQLKTSPKGGSNLSTRVNRPTNKKYFVIEKKYLMFYEVISDTEVHVSDILPAKSNWQRVLF